MPFKSKAQRRKFAELLVKGEISPETFEEWNRETGGARLPERVKRAAKRATKKKAKPKSRRTTRVQGRGKEREALAMNRRAAGAATTSFARTATALKSISTRSATFTAPPGPPRNGVIPKSVCLTEKVDAGLQGVSRDPGEDVERDRPRLPHQRHGADHVEAAFLRLHFPRDQPDHRVVRRPEHLGAHRLAHLADLLRVRRGEHLETVGVIP